MKRTYLLFIAVAMLVFSCCEKYDDSELVDRLSEVEQTLDELVAYLESLAEASEELENRLDALDTVISVDDIMDGDEVVGYTISLSGSDPIYIYNGADGATGATGSSAASYVSAVSDTDSGTVTIIINGKSYTFSAANTADPETLSLTAQAGYISSVSSCFSVGGGGVDLDNLKSISVTITDNLNGEVSVFRTSDSDTFSVGSWAVCIADKNTISIAPTSYDFDRPLTGGTLKVVYTNGLEQEYVASASFTYKVDDVSAYSSSSYPLYADVWVVDGVSAALSASNIGSSGALSSAYSADASRAIEVVAGSGITSVGESAFSSCKSLTSISLPAVETIGDQAFEYLDLTSISLPAAKTIGDGAFLSCSLLTSISLSVAETIGGAAFYGCTSLSSISLPSAEAIGAKAFLGCSALKSISFPAVTIVGYGTFYRCTNLADISLPSVTSIGGGAFSGCTALETIELGTGTSLGVEYIGYYAKDLPTFPEFEGDCDLKIKFTSAETPVEDTASTIIVNEDNKTLTVKNTNDADGTKYTFKSITVEN